MTGSWIFEPTEVNVTPSISLIKLARDCVGSVGLSSNEMDLWEIVFVPIFFSFSLIIKTELSSKISWFRYIIKYSSSVIKRES